MIDACNCMYDDLEASKMGVSKGPPEDAGMKRGLGVTICRVSKKH